MLGSPGPDGPVAAFQVFARRGFSIESSVGASEAENTEAQLEWTQGGCTCLSASNRYERALANQRAGQEAFSVTFHYYLPGNR